MASLPNEAQWLQALKRSEPVACRRLVEIYMPSLHAFFRGLGFRSPLIDDLIQETFLEVWRSLSNFRGEASLKTWLFLLGRRLAWKHLRRSRHHEPLLSEEDEVLAEDSYPPGSQEEWFWIRQRDEALRSCIGKLPLLYREILSLHYMEEMTFQEIAKVLEIAEGTVKSRVSKALRLLREEVLRCFQIEVKKEGP